MDLTITKIPTHFRFLNKEEAKYWDRSTEDWNPIAEIHVQGNNEYYEIAAGSFAWVTYNVKSPNLEFKVDKFTKKDFTDER